MHERFETHSEEETRTAGRRLAAALPPSALVAFSGDLGSGKTAFIRGMCEFFGCAAQVSSPTFALINEYEGAHRVSHCDLYRLTPMPVIGRIFSYPVLEAIAPSPRRPKTVGAPLQRAGAGREALDAQLIALQRAQLIRQRRRVPGSHVQRGCSVLRHHVLALWLLDVHSGGEGSQLGGLCRVRLHRVRSAARLP